MNDDELLDQIKNSARRGRAAEARVRPLDELERARLARSLAASLPAGRSRARKRTLYARVGALGGAMALAAALALVARRPSTPDDLPSYDMTLVGGAREYRGDAPAERSGPLRMRKGDRLEAILRPPARSTGPLAARASLVRRDAPSPAPRVAYRGAPEVAPEGTVRVSATLDDFPGVTPGAWDLVVVVGRPEALAAAPDALEPRPGLRVQRAAVVVE